MSVTHFQGQRDIWENLKKEENHLEIIVKKFQNIIIFHVTQQSMILAETVKENKVSADKFC